MRFLRRMFRGDVRVDALKGRGNPEQTREIVSHTPTNEISDRYFDTMARMQTAISSNNFEEAVTFIRQNLGYIPGWVEESRRQFGSLEVSTIPALQQGGRVLALAGDEEGLAKMQDIVDSTTDLTPWANRVREHHDDLRLFGVILDAVTRHPNCLQTDVKGLIGEPDGRRVATLISYLERAGKIVRVRKGRTYEIALSGATTAPSTPPKRVVGSHRKDRTSSEPREIDLSTLSYVPLPPSPSRWEETAMGEVARFAELTSHFEVRDTDWRIVSIEGIPRAERPDPAFRKMRSSGSGILVIDDLGKAQGLGHIKAAALRYDQTGSVAAKVGMQHGTYRIGVHPLGRGLIAMSRDCVVHAYDDGLSLILETSLSEAPEILALKQRFEMSDRNLKNHIRCVALSAEARSYLFTAVDEAWCVEMGGKALWGAKLPLKEGWTRVAAPSSNPQTSAEVQRALEVMGLSLPIDPDMVKQRYRLLAKQWHPDLNLGTEQSHELMKALNLAAETLTGIEASSLPRYAGAEFVRDENSSEFKVDGLKVTMTTSLMTDEIHASDWIYAACYAASSDSVYLAGYSGRVVRVNEQGNGVRAYDIGSVPRQIVDTGDYLYLLTDTRLYILRDDQLVALMDTHEAGDLVVAQTGFGLLEKKRIRWFREDGQYLGEVLSKDPMRRVYSVDDRMIVETRQRRAVIEGVPTFWE